MFDAKQESSRVNTGRKKRDRIYRSRTNVQKRLNVYIAYVNIGDARSLYGTRSENLTAFLTKTP